MHGCTKNNEKSPQSVTQPDRWQRRRPSRPTFAWAVCSLLAVACCAASAPARTLQWKLEADQRYRISVERTVQQKSLATEWAETIRYQVLWVVVGRDADGQMQIIQSLTEVKHVLQFLDAKPVVYDSASDVEPQGEAAELARYWKSQLGIERSLTLMPNGSLKPVGTPLAAPPAGGTTGASSPAASRPSVQPLLTDVAWTLPTKDVTVDDTWEETELVPWREIPDAIKVTTSYTYRGEENIDGAQLDNIVVKARWDVQPTLSASRKLRVDRQSGSGVIYFDQQAGCLSRSNFSQELSVQVLDAESQSIQAEISTSMKLHCQRVIAVIENGETAAASE